MKRLATLLLFLIPLTILAQPKTYTIAFLNKKSDAETISPDSTKKLMEGHMANINRLASEGKLLAAGPFDGGGGLFILNTTSLEEARSWINTDPAVQANRWNIELLPYSPRIGSVCPVSEPYEMVSYAFIRFNAIVEKFTASTYPNLIREHESYIKEIVDPANIVTEATFGPNEGGILILKNEVASDAFARDPAVQQGLVHVQMKKLYIAKSSFCEE